MTNRKIAEQIIERFMGHRIADVALVDAITAALDSKDSARGAGDRWTDEATMRNAMVLVGTLDPHQLVFPADFIIALRDATPLPLGQRRR